MRTAKLGAKRVFPFKRSSVRTAFENALSRAKIDDFTFHDLRRTFGTRLLKKGVNLVTIRNLYGHSGTEVTERYLHPENKLADETVDLLVEADENRAHSVHTETEKPVEIPANRTESVS